MPVLENVRHERFVNYIVKGMSQAEAYKSAGFRGKNVDTNASEILRRPEVKARLKELTSRISKSAVAQASAKLAIDKEWVLRVLVENVERGKAVKGGSSVVNRAAELIGKHLGMFQDGTDKPLNVEDLTADQIRQLLGNDAPPPPAVLQ